MSDLATLITNVIANHKEELEHMLQANVAKTFYQPNTEKNVMLEVEMCLNDEYIGVVHSCKVEFNPKNFAINIFVMVDENKYLAEVLRGRKIEKILKEHVIFFVPVALAIDIKVVPSEYEELPSYITVEKIIAE